MLGSGPLGGLLRGITTDVLTQGVAVATGLQHRFDFAEVAAAGVGGGISGSIPLGGALGHAIGGMAGAIANAATRTVLTGTDFGDNIIAALPSVIGSTVGNFLVDEVDAHVRAARQNAVDRARGGADTQPPHLSVNMAALPIDDTVTDYSGARNAQLAAVAPGAAAKLRAAVKMGSLEDVSRLRAIMAPISPTAPGTSTDMIPAYGHAAGGGPVFSARRTDPDALLSGEINGEWYFGGTDEERAAYGGYLKSRGWIGSDLARKQALFNTLDTETRGNDLRLDGVITAFADMASMPGADPSTADARDVAMAVQLKHRLDYGNRADQLADDVNRPLEIFAAVAFSPVLVMGGVEAAGTTAAAEESGGVILASGGTTAAQRASTTGLLALMTLLTVSQVTQNQMDNPVSGTDEIPPVDAGPVENPSPARSKQGIAQPVTASAPMPPDPDDFDPDWDPNNRLRPSEKATLSRLRAMRPDLDIRAAEAERDGEYVDNLGDTYEQIGNPRASGSKWNESEFMDSLKGHINKSSTYLVVDMTGFETEHAAVVRTYLNSLSEAANARIIRIGF